MKKVNKDKITNKKNIVLIIFLVAVLIALSLLIFFQFKKYIKECSYTFKLTTKEINVKLNDKVNPEDYIKKTNNVKVKYISIITNKIGVQDLTYYVIDKLNKGHYYHIKVNVIDDIAPIIEGKTKVSIYTGSKIDILSYVKATDNYDKDVEVKTNGEVNTNKEGTYKVTYTASDKSGNESTHVIEFTVKNKPVVVEQPSNNAAPSGKTSKGYTIETKNGATYIKGILVANKTYSLSKSYGSGLTQSTKDAFNEMKKAASLDGYDLYIGSGYRSYKTQNTVYNNYVKRDGKTKADTYSARPGHSEHQTGLAIDICARGGYKCIGSGFDGTKPANWLSENAYKYGFILRYPKGKTNETGYKFESWHYRYVGKELAKELYNGGNWITLESYLGITSKYSN